MSRRKNLSKASVSCDAGASLRISEVARRVGISSSALRAWETLGLIKPQRTRSRYRLYNEADVRLLQRAIFLRRARGLNPAAIVHVLKRQGVVATPAENTASPGLRFRRLRHGRNLSLAQVASATGVSVGFLSALERGQMSASIGTCGASRATIAPIFFLSSSLPGQFQTRAPNRAQILETTKGVRMELLAWGNTAMEPHLFRIKPGGGSGESYTHEGEEFLHILRGEFEIWVNTDEHYRMKPGDSLYFQSSTPHRWRNPGKTESWLLWINTPPTF
jgi:DNA-binding transcriptional MerR regulator/mannose-6-phosphate isomerase-like protein (cupin superfamily)